MPVEQFSPLTVLACDTNSEVLGTSAGGGHDAASPSLSAAGAEQQCSYSSY